MKTNFGRKRRQLRNPKGIVSGSPGLRGTSYPGFQDEGNSTPTGLCHVPGTKPQPRWGCSPLASIPKVARSLPREIHWSSHGISNATAFISRGEQPWALSRNPFGIQLWNFRKALTSILLLAALTTGFSQPVITTDPQSQTNVVGTDATFTVVATGSDPLDYQWRFGPSNLPLSGKTNAALVLTNVQTANARNLPTQNVREINNQKGKQT